MPVVQAVVPDKENSLVIRVFSRRLFFYLFGCAGSSWLHRHLSSCSEQGILSASQGSGFSCCGAQALEHWASRAAAPGLQSTDSAVVLHGLTCSMGSSWTRDQTCVSYTGRPILYHCVSRGALGFF